MASDLLDFYVGKNDFTKGESLVIDMPIGNIVKFLQIWRKSMKSDLEN